MSLGILKIKGNHRKQKLLRDQFLHIPTHQIKALRSANQTDQIYFKRCIRLHRTHK